MTCAFSLVERGIDRLVEDRVRGKRGEVVVLVLVLAMECTYGTLKGGEGTCD